MIHSAGILAPFDILDSGQETSYDDIAILAAHICGTPISYVSFVEGSRQWFKARFGFDMTENTLENSFCRYTLQQASTLVIPDLSHDQRTASHALVKDAPNLRFYAGALLQTENAEILGTVCVMDVQPHPGGLSREQQAALEALARQVGELLQLRRSLRERDIARAQSNASEQRYKAVFNSAVDQAVIIIDPSGKIAEWNVGAERMFGWTTADAAGLDVEQLIDVETDAQPTLANALQQPLLHDERQLRRRNGEQFWARVETMPLQLIDGGNSGFVKIIRDNSAQRQVEALREAMTGELAHRIKNTMSIVRSMASQSFAAPPHAVPLKAYELRLQALGAAHDILLKRDWEAGSLAGLIAAALAPHAATHQISLHGEDIDVSPFAAVSVSMLIHELATNAIKYGALSSSTGRVKVEWRVDHNSDEAMMSMWWRENGGPPAKQPTSQGFGSRLIRSGLAGARQVELDFKATGLEATFKAPLSSLQFFSKL